MCKLITTTWRGCPPIIFMLKSFFQASIDSTGSPLTDEALAAAVKADAVILGAIGGPVCIFLAFPMLKEFRNMANLLGEMGHRKCTPRAGTPEAPQGDGHIRQRAAL